MTFSAAQIAMLINGKTEGDATVQVASFGKIEEAQAGQLAFLANPKYEDYLYSTAASVIIVNETQELKQPITGYAYTCARCLYCFCNPAFKIPGNQFRSKWWAYRSLLILPKTAKLGDHVFIAALAYLGENVRVGNNVKIFPHVFLGDNVQ